MNKPWRSRCMRCHRTINPRPTSVLVRGSDPCVFCSRTQVHPEEAIALMRESGAEPLEPFPGARPKWRCRCLRCGREIFPRMYSIRAGGGPCPQCGRSKNKNPIEIGRFQAGIATTGLDIIEGIERMRLAGLEPTAGYPGLNSLPWPAKCLRCGAAVNASFATATDKKGKGGCLVCANINRGNAQRIKPELAVMQMRNAGAEPLDSYIDGATPWRCRCLKCGREIRPRLSIVNQGNNPCPLCPKGTGSGFDRIKPAIVYLITHPLLDSHKIGIAGVESKRLPEHRRNGWEVFKILYFESGQDAYRVEQDVLNWMRSENAWPPSLSTGSGWTETVDAETVSLPTIWRQVQKYSRLIARDS